MSTEFNLFPVTENTVMGNHEEGRSNAGAVNLPDFIVAIDCTMWPQTARLFRKALEEQYQKPVKYLHVTHSHGDHIMGLAAFKDAIIFSSSQLPHSLQKRMQIQWQAEQMQEMKESGMAPVEWIEEVEFIIPPIVFPEQMQIVNHEQQIEFHHSGGHTDDSSWAYFPDEQVLFAGDLIFAEMFPYAGDYTCNPEKWITVLRKWMDMPINKVVPGHGPLMGLEIVEQTLNGFELLKANTLNAIAKNAAAEDINIPDVFTVPDDGIWMVQKTLSHWQKFYMDSSD
jgi:glyoxylase-like metal-dependent hydrolase (beta-lactamase superfamily II)